MSREVWVPIVLLVGGGICIVEALQVKQGKRREIFLPLPTNTQIPRDRAYGLWPTGIGCLLAGVGLLLDNRMLMMIGLMVVIPFALVLMAWKPRWLKPDWLLWLEEHYGPELTERMLQRGRDRGQAPPPTQEGLEAWAAKMTWGDDA